MIRIITAMLLLTSAAYAQVEPRIPTEEEKITALKLAYELNGRSMVRWGAIDLTGPVPMAPFMPLPDPDRVIPLTRDQTR